jgi:acetyltransferase-like isoleucine patch superfamily enzyme
MIIMNQKRNLLFSLNSKYKIKLHSSSMLLAGLCSLTPAAYALSVTSQTPAVNALDQNANSDITIVFDDVMGNSISGKFIVNGSFTGPIDGTFLSTDENITFNPTNDFKPGETVTTTLTTDLQSSVGASLPMPQTSQFTVKVAASSPGNFLDSGQSLGNTNSKDVSLGDVDGDGDLDAVVANDGANKLWLNDGSGIFSDSGQSLGSYNSNSMSLGDVDGDGDLDAMVANNGANKLWLNDGSGIFSDSSQSLGSYNSRSVSLGDVDGDGDLDAMVANYNNQANKLWLNDGSGNFTDSGQSLGDSSSSSVSLGDVDGDGDLDAVVANFGSPNKLWLNDGSGTFIDSGQSLGSSESHSVSLGDVDGDGDLDAMVANYAQANKLWLNDGSGIFTDSGQSLGSSDSYDVLLGDVDGDGDLDAVVANGGQANKLWLNDGSGIFTDSGQSLGNSNSRGISLGDVDGDGDLDAVVANGAQANKVWLNNPPFNEAPINTIPASTQTTNEDTDLVFSTSNSNLISIADPDAEDNSVQVTLTVTDGTVSLSGNGGLTFITGSGTDDANMVFTGTVTDINTALEGMSFTPTADFHGDATIQIEFDDQSSLGALTATDTVTITVNPVNDVPSFTKGADQTVNEDSGAQTISNWATDISAGPSDESSQTLSFTVNNDNNSLFSVQPVIDASGTLSFTPAADATGSAVVTVILNDGTDDSAPQTFNISISDVNEEPSNTVPATQTTNEDIQLVFSSENSNQISITDTDAENNSVQVTLTVSEETGTLTLSGINGLTFITGSGTDDANMVFTGTVTDINTALEGMSFTPTADFHGDATIQIEFDDQSSLGALTATDTVTITVNPVNDIPSFIKGDDQTVFANAGSQNIELWATDISVGPENESSQTSSFIVTNDNNSLFSAQPAIDAEGNLSFTPASAGSATVTVILSDGEDSSEAQSFNITINSVPSTPVVEVTPEPTECTAGANINCTIQNEGTLTDVKIEPEGSIEGGTIEGEIKNEGTLINITLAAGTKVDGGQIQGQIQGNSEAPAVLNNVQVNENTKLSNVIIENNVVLSKDVILIDVQLRGSSVSGGTLEGTIRTSSSATVIKDVSLGENTNIIGGKLAGTITGNKKNPAILQHLKVEEKTNITNAIVADGVDIPKDVKLGSGVRFTKADNIPEGVDLTETLPNITPKIVEVKQPSAVDLLADPIVNGIGLLPKINILPVIVSTTNKVNQNNNTGFLTLHIETIFYAVIPMQVQHGTRKPRAIDAGVRLGFGQTVYFTTEDGIEVIANPAVQDVKLLKDSLEKINLPTVIINNDGNIQIPVTDKLSYFGRPDLAATKVDQETATGFINKENGNVALVFEDEDGQKREQILYPTPANISAIEEFTTEAELTVEGNLKFKLGEQNYEGKLDYAVVHGEAPTDGKLQVTNIDDKQLLIVYPDGLRQILKLN